MLPSVELKKQIFRRYNEEPKDWYVFTSRDLRGYLDTIVVHGQDVWLIKEEQINPYESTGFGVRERVEKAEAFRASSPYPFGFRPLPQELVKEMMKAIGRGTDIRESIDRAMGIRPLPIHKIRSDVMMQGPILYSPKPVRITPNQEALDAKLRLELGRLLNRKYPHLLSTYH